MRCVAHAFRVALLFVGAIGALSLGSGWHGALAAETAAQTKTESAPAPRIRVAIAKRREIVERVLMSGSLVPREEVLVGPEIDGLRILELLVEEGDRVAKGQVLARLSRETLDAKLAQSDAALARADAAIAQASSQITAAEAAFELAKAELKRTQTLVSRGVSSRALLDQRTSAANTAAAQLQVARDNLRAAQAEKKNQEAVRRELAIQIRRTEIRATSAGIITQRTAKIGALAAAAQPPLFRIIKDGKIELDAEVPEQRILSIHLGQPADIYLANGEIIHGTVRLVSPQVDPASRLGHVRIALEDSKRARIGSFARARVEIRRSMAVTVPVSAVLYDAGNARVQLVEDARIKTRSVELGLVEGGYAEIRKGVIEGQQVVFRAGAFLRDGDSIAPVMQKTGSR